VLLSSHILSEVEQLCDRVSIIRAGKTVESGTLSELRHLTRTEVSFVEDGVTDAAIARIPASHDVVVADGRVRFTADSDQLTAVLPVLAELEVQGLTIAPPSLEELFLRHYGDDITGETSGSAAGRAAASPESEATAGASTR
jgi:ABC-2 type transport system ATP-binding protein